MKKEIKKSMKEMKEEIKNLMNDMNINYEESEDNKILISDRNKIEILSYLDYKLSDNEIESLFEKKIQIHNKKDKDIKIDMRKMKEYNLKLIYHRKKNDEKEYRLFISFKDDNSQLRRIRYINDEIKKIHSNENDMIKLFNDISYQKINNYIQKKIS
jgi:hypothetical protein